MPTIYLSSFLSSPSLVSCPSSVSPSPSLHPTLDPLKKVPLFFCPCLHLFILVHPLYLCLPSSTSCPLEKKKKSLVLLSSPRFFLTSFIPPLSCKKIIPVAFFLHPPFFIVHPLYPPSPILHASHSPLQKTYLLSPVPTLSSFLLIPFISASRPPSLLTLKKKKSPYSSPFFCPPHPLFILSPAKSISL